METTLCAEEVGALEDGVFEADVLEVEALEADSFKLEAELTAVLEAELCAAEEAASEEDGKPDTTTDCVPQAGSRKISVSTKNSNFIFFIQLPLPSFKDDYSTESSSLIRVVILTLSLRYRNRNF